MLLLLLACSSPSAPTPGASGPAPMKPATCTLLTVNDTYQIEGLPDQTGGIARLRTLRKQIEKESGPVVVLHAGDMLSPSLPSRTFGGDQMIDSLNRLDGDPLAMDERLIVVFGNHEFDASKEADGPKLDTRIEASQFTWLDSSIVWGKNGEGKQVVEAPNMVGSRVLDCQGIKLGVFGLTISSKKAAYIDDFREPLNMARAQTEALRKAGAEVVIGLTHQTFAEDQELLKTLGDAGPDFIVGGHEHVHMTTDVGRRAVYKADADARSAWRITLSREATGYRRDAELIQLNQAMTPDPELQTAVDNWLAKDDAAVCAKIEKAPGCLADSMGQAGVELVAEELQIRSYETNFGNWIADVARASCPKADVAFLNSGSLRLNRDIPPGPVLRKDIETLFAYPMGLRLVRINGATLQQVVDRATQGWSGNGNWLQISGFSWWHDTKAGSASRLTLLGSAPHKVAPTESILAVIPDFLLDPNGGQDGYTMLLPEMELKGAEAKAACGQEFAPGDLKNLVYAAMAPSLRGTPMAPGLEGRICSAPVEENFPCLALP